MSSTSSVVEDNVLNKNGKYPAEKKVKVSRLEQNRRAAKQSRQKKKGMVDGLQKVEVFFRESNSDIRQKNDELVRLLMQADLVVATITNPNPQNEQEMHASNGICIKSDELLHSNYNSNQVSDLIQNGANIVTIADIEPPVISSTSTVVQPQAPPIPIYTMQAMSNFQNAAAAAMQTAMMEMSHYNPTTSEQLAYADAMTAKAIGQQNPSRDSGQQIDNQNHSNSGVAFLASSVYANPHH